MARDFGVTRVLARLARHYRYYPCPPWWERGRSAVAALPGDDTSAADADEHVRVVGVRRAWRRRQTACSPCRPGGAAPHADARTTQRGAGAADRSRRGGRRLARLDSRCRRARSRDPGCKPRRAARVRVRLVCGGRRAGRWAHRRGWRRPDVHGAGLGGVHRRARRRHALTLSPTAGNIGLELHWIPDRYVSPVDGRGYSSEGGWRRYYPPSPVSAEQPRVADRIVLLTSSHDLAGRVRAGAPRRLRQRDRARVRAHVRYRARARRDLRPDRAPPQEPARVVGRGDLDETRIAALIGRVAAPAVIGGSVAFECRLTTPPKPS